ncbi:hypothetical protein BB559_002034 [Furculomyces boomerangus]|uniref:Mannose-P-dolichol utilization defect 1 protein homolog n=2 Tax=Harpellales TaxID=61421 RepID=A0A2T9YYK6_9FUNG|nr:hypothetical protein BB559_002034 [Furculomyces boomerangus]PVZ96970.1 hypothetical protein BB558_007090 [Smittium angustum]PVZ98241.1 hypothetical protein BB558_005751 [Smittium angustum]PWA01591.1 hypothetical protein BB558_002292 [Smittium angustum]
MLYSLIRKPASLLIGEECTKILLDELNFFNKACLKHAIIEGLSFGLVLGGSIVKLPQIYKSIKSNSTFGISLTSVLLECISNIIFFSYNYRNGNGFTKYGESFFIGLQNIILLALIYKNLKKNYFVIVGIMLLVWAFILNRTLTPLITLNFIQLFSVPLMVSSRVSQIRTNHIYSSTGQLSAFTILANFVGTFARVITVIFPVKDIQLVFTNIINAIVNGILAYQLYLYWDSSKPDKNKYAFDFGSKSLASSKFNLAKDNTFKSNSF